MTVLGAAALSVLWLGGFAAFVYGFYDANVVPLLSLPPMVWAGLVAASLLPVGFIWVGTAILMRLAQVSEDAMRLATISRELIDPTTTAANDVAKLGAVIRKELEGLNREVDGAVARVGMLEGRLKQQTTLIDETSARVEKRTGEMATRLSGEREKIDAITRTLSTEGRIVAETLDTQAHAINTSAKKAAEALQDAEQALEKRTAGLDKAAGEAAETTKTIAGDIERETGKLEAVAANARSRSEAITARFSEQHKLMVETVDSQAEQQARLDAAMEQQHHQIGKMSDTVSRQVAKMSETVARQTSTMAETVAQQIARVDETVAQQTIRTAEAVAEQIQRIEKSAGEQTTALAESVAGQVANVEKTAAEQTTGLARTVAGQIALVEKAAAEQTKGMAEIVTQQIASVEQSLATQTSAMAANVAKQVDAIQTALARAGTDFESAVDQARAHALAAGEGFEGQATTMAEAADAAATRLDDAVETVKLLSSQTRDDLDIQVRTADALFQQQADAARKLLSGQADDLGAALETSLSQMKARMTGFADQGNEALMVRANELDDALRRSEQRMRALYQRLDESIRGVTEGSESVGKQLSETADAFEARMAQFPAHAEDAANKVRTQINSQIEQLAKLADGAAEKARALTQALATQPRPEVQEETKPTPSKSPPAPKTPELRAPVPVEDEVTPRLPGRDVYPAVWEGMERPGTTRPRLGRPVLGRPVLGSFDDLAKNLAGRLRPGGRKDGGVPSGIQAAQSTGAVKQAREEDISDFRIIRHDNPEPAAKGDQARDTGKTGADLSRPAPEPAKKLLPKLEERGWKDILASVDKREAELNATVSRTAGGDDASFERDALLIIERLQAMSIDLNRALEDAPSPDLLDRYMTGERNVFARRLATYTGPEMLDKIARKHREDNEFRTYVSRYIESFEDLLKAARGRDRENILLETYLTSQTGKVYMILGTAIGHLKQKDV